MLKGTVVENSLADKSILDQVTITRTWEDGSWILHDISLEKSQAEQFGKYLVSGPWYVHFWEPGKDEILVVFQDKNFTIKQSDKSTWADAISHGKSRSIPEEQLDFVVVE